MSAIVHGLFHIAVKTAKLESSLAFYKDVLGLMEIARPDFGYPGAWLACPGLTGGAIVHLYAGGPALGADGAMATGTAAIDHISLSCSGFHAFRARFAVRGLPWREFLVPGTTLWQLFVYDPSGVQMELTFEGALESGEPPDMTPGRAYVAGSSFFAPIVYE